MTHCQQTNFTVKFAEEDIEYLLDPPTYLNRYSFRFSQRKKFNLTIFIKEITCESHTIPLIYTKKVIIPNEKEYNDFYQVGQFPMWYYKKRFSSDCQTDQYHMSSTPCKVIPEDYNFQRYFLGPLFDTLTTMLFITIVFFLDVIFKLSHERKEEEEEEIHDNEYDKEVSISDLNILINQINNANELSKKNIIDFLFDWLKKREYEGDTIENICNDLEPLANNPEPLKTVSSKT
jgi:hypothetical protein